MHTIIATVLAILPLAVIQTSRLHNENVSVIDLFFDITFVICWQLLVCQRNHKSSRM